jgi:hypothetical protein
VIRVQLAGGAVDRHQLGAGGEEFRRAAFIDDHMGLAVAEDLAAGAIEAGERQRVGRRARTDEEDRDVAFEDFGKGLFHTLVEVAGAVGRGEAAGCGRRGSVRCRDGRRPSCRMRKTCGFQFE